MRASVRRGATSSFEMRVTSSGPGGRGCFREREPSTYELRAYVGKLKIALFFVRKSEPDDLATPPRRAIRLLPERERKIVT